MDMQTGAAYLLMREERKYIGTVAYMGGVPSLPEPFVWSWTQMMQYNAENLGHIYYMRSGVSFHATARNQIVDQMKGDWVLMLDTDNAFPPDILHRMLKRMETHELDVLVGMYQFKSHPHSPVMFKWNGNTTLRLTEYQAHKFDQFFYFPVECAGAGCLLVKNEVFDRILAELRENPFDILPPLGEDFSFFKRLQRLDIKAWCDPAIHVEHLTYRGIRMKDFDREALRA